MTLHFDLCRRIHSESSRVLEMVEVSGDQDVHRRGLHLVFEDDLSPFVSVVPFQVSFLAVRLVSIHSLGHGRALRFR